MSIYYHVLFFMSAILIVTLLYLVFNSVRFVNLDTPSSVMYFVLFTFNSVKHTRFFIP